MRRSQNLPLPPTIYPLFKKYNIMRRSQNLPLPPRIYPHFQQLYTTLSESTPPSQNVTPFSTIICDPPRIHPSLPESTPPPLFQQLYYYATLSESTSLSQNIPNFQQLYTTLSESNHPSQNIPPLFNNYNMRPSLNLPLPEYIPLFNIIIFWEGGVDYGRVAHINLLKRGCILRGRGRFWEGRIIL